MASEQVRAAAERLLSPTRHDGSIKEVFASNRQFCDDVKAVATAYLAEHPADDDREIDEEWLAAIGFDDKDGCMMIRNGEENVVSYLKSIGGFFVQGRGVVIKKTRATIRRLCAALNIPLQEQPPC